MGFIITMLLVFALCVWIIAAGMRYIIVTLTAVIPPVIDSVFGAWIHEYRVWRYNRHVRREKIKAELELREFERESHIRAREARSKL